jgi:hypothetical protein
MDKFWGVIAELKRIHPFGVQGHYKTLHQAWESVWRPSSGVCRIHH